MNTGKAGKGIKYTKLKDVKFSFIKARAFQMAQRKRIKWKELEEWKEGKARRIGIWAVIKDDDS